MTSIPDFVLRWVNAVYSPPIGSMILGFATAVAASATFAFRNSRIDQKDYEYRKSLIDRVLTTTNPEEIPGILSYVFQSHTAPPNYNAIEKLVNRLEQLLDLQERSVSSSNFTPATLFDIKSTLNRTTQDANTEFSAYNTEARYRNMNSSTLYIHGENYLANAISHALLTPLSRIDTIAKILNSNHESKEITSLLPDLKSALQICYTYLSAFRATSFKPSGFIAFSTAIQNAANVYVRESSKVIELSISSPDQLASGNEYRLLAAALPLIENAVDASVDNDKIDIIVKEESDSVELTISNCVRSDFDISQLFMDGYSTKNDDMLLGAHTGLGLGISRNLVGAIPGGNVTCAIIDGCIVFTISIPRQ